MGEHLAALRRDGDLMAIAIADAAPDAPVPRCPGWCVRDVVHHTGEVHRWATHIVREAGDGSIDSEVARGPLPDDASLAAWFRDGHAALVAALDDAPGDLQCFAFLPAPSPRAFWARRQAHETAVHRADVERALDRLTPVPADVAVDGIDELVSGFGARRRSKLRSDPPVTLGLRATDTGTEWRVTIEPEQLAIQRDEGVDGASCVASADASTLFLFLWNRMPRDVVDVRGDSAVLDLWQDRLQIRWS